MNAATPTTLVAVSCDQGEHVTGKLDDPEWRRERARKAGRARLAKADRRAESDAASVTALRPVRRLAGSRRGSHGRNGASEATVP